MPKPKKIKHKPSKPRARKPLTKRSVRSQSVAKGRAKPVARKKKPSARKKEPAARKKVVTKRLERRASPTKPAPRIARARSAPAELQRPKTLPPPPSTKRAPRR